MDIKATLEVELGPVTEEELDFAINHFEINCAVAKTERKLYNETVLDILATCIEFFRTHGLGGENDGKSYKI